jgi:hypothetical protein
VPRRARIIRVHAQAQACVEVRHIGADRNIRKRRASAFSGFRRRSGLNRRHAWIAEGLSHCYRERLRGRDLTRPEGLGPSDSNAPTQILDLRRRERPIAGPFVQVEDGACVDGHGANILRHRRMTVGTERHGAPSPRRACLVQALERDGWGRIDRPRACPGGRRENRCTDAASMPRAIRSGLRVRTTLRPDATCRDPRRPPRTRYPSSKDHHATRPASSSNLPKTQAAVDGRARSSARRSTVSRSTPSFRASSPCRRCPRPPHTGHRQGHSKSLASRKGGPAT